MTSTNGSRPASPREFPEIQRGALQANLVPNGRTKRGNGRGQAFSEVGLYQIEDAAEFSADRALSDPLQLIAEFRRHEVSRVLREATDTSPRSHVYAGPGVPFFPAKKVGRPRVDGDYAAVYLAQVVAGMTKVQPFYDVFCSTDLWRICGFDSVPAQSLVQQRLRELDERPEAFAVAAEELIRIAKAVEPRVGEIVAVDATGWHSPSALEHCCVDDAACKAVGGSPPSRLQSSEAIEVLKARWAEADIDDENLAEPEGEAGFPRVERMRSADGRVRQFSVHKIGGHFYRSLDLDSGFRSYDVDTKWFGGYLLAAIDAVTGLPVGFEVFGAHIQEWNGYPALFERMRSALGEAPYIVSTDKGYAYRNFYEFNTRCGVAVVSPRRGLVLEARTKLRTVRFDEHGIPRCPHCYGETTQDAPGLGLTFTPSGEPTIRFRCLRPWFPGCHQVQSIHCAEDWRMLVPLSRKTELYQGVRWAHSNKEHVFRHARERYGLGGKNFATQLGRSGVAPQRVRAYASLTLDWFRLNLRQGWIAPVELPVNVVSGRPKRLSGLQDRLTGDIIEPGCGTQRLRKMLGQREEDGTDLPYGPAADALLSGSLADRSL